MVIKIKAPDAYKAKLQLTPGDEYDEHLGDNTIKKFAAKSVMANTSVESKSAGADSSSQTKTMLAGKGIELDDHAIGKPVMFSSPPYNVSVQTGRSVNLGNFNNAKLVVTLSVPCVEADIESAYEFAANWTGGKIDEMMKAIKGE